MRRALRSRSLRSIVAGLSLLAAAGCTSTREYDDVLRNRSSCDSCPPSPWALYREMSSGKAPCAGPEACACAAPKADCACPSVDAYPANARPGEAWCRVVIPARYETVREPVQSVCASVERDWVPPVMETRVRRVSVVPACEEVICTPGATRTDVMCSEGCPARKETCVTREQGPCGCVTRCVEVSIPATDCTTRRDVCIQAPGRHVVRTPEQFIGEPCLVEVTPGRWVDKPIAPVVEMRTRIVCVSPERVEWRRNPSCQVPAPIAAPACRPLTR